MVQKYGIFFNCECCADISIYIISSASQKLCFSFYEFHTHFPNCYPVISYEHRKSYLLTDAAVYKTV